MSELWTITKTATYFGVTVRCINNWCMEGKLVRKKFGGTVRITYESILNLYNNPR